MRLKTLIKSISIVLIIVFSLTFVFAETPSIVLRISNNTMLNNDADFINSSQDKFEFFNQSLNTSDDVIFKSITFQTGYGELNASYYININTPSLNVNNITADYCIADGSYLSNVNVTDIWVNSSGDTMTGDLYMNSNKRHYFIGSGSYGSPDANIFASAGNIYVSSTGGKLNLGGATYYISTASTGGTSQLKNLILTSSGNALTLNSGNINIDDDNQGLQIGEGQDWWVYFDGTNAHIDSRDTTANDDLLFTDFDSYDFDNDIIVDDIIPKTTQTTIKGETQIGNDTSQNHGVNIAPTSNRGLNKWFKLGQLSTEYGEYLDFDVVSSTYLSGQHIADTIDMDMTGSYNSNINFPSYIAQAITVTDAIVYDSLYYEYPYSYAQQITNTFQGTLDATTNYEQFGRSLSVSGDLGTSSTTIKYGDKITISGTADDSYGYWVSVTGGTNNYAIWGDAGDVVLDNDNQKIRIGETQGDWDMWHDGTNNIFNTTNDAIWSFYNSTGLGRIRVGDVVYSTPEMSDSMSSLDNMKTPSLITREGKTEEEFHQSYPDAVQTYIDVKDVSNCWIVIDKYCYIDEGIETNTEERIRYVPYQVLEDTEVYDEETGENIIMKVVVTKYREEVYEETTFTPYNRTGCYEFEIAEKSYNYTTTRTECGTKPELAISGGQGYLDNYNLIWQLRQENDMLKSELCARDMSYSWCSGGVEL